MKICAYGGTELTELVCIAVFFRPTVVVGGQDNVQGEFEFLPPSPLPIHMYFWRFQKLGGDFIGIFPGNCRLVFVSSAG